MLLLLRNFKISARLNTIFVFFILSMLLFVWLQRTHLETSLLQSKQNTPKSVVEIALGITHSYYQQSQSGLISEDEAKQRALKKIESLRYDEKEYLWVNGYDHIMLMHPIKPALNGKDVSGVKDPNGKFLFQAFVTQVKKTGGGFVDYLWPKPGFEKPVPKISYVEGFKPWGWVIGSGLYIDDVYQDANDMTVTLVLSLSVVGLILCIILFLVNRSINAPLSDAVKRMNDIASGEGDLTSKLAVEGHDELAQLAKDFNIFVDKIRATVVNVGDAVTQLSSSTELLSEAVSVSASRMSDQKSETDQVASAITELSASAVEIAQSSETASENSMEARAQVESGRQVMSSSLQTISELASEMNLSQESINNLRVETENIGSLLTVIRGIAEQTNLLALNAAIEAARAGEQGRGFAVVADEVRTLAGKTQEATEEIDDMISKLQSGALSAVEAIEQSASKTNISLEYANEAEQSLIKIDSAIDVISNMNSHIASASDEQRKVSEEINQNIVRIVNLTNETALTAEQVQASGNEIRTVGTTLNELVNQFKA